MTGPARVRWRPGACGDNLLGYVGTLPSWAFQIFSSGDPAEGRKMIAQLPGMSGVVARDPDPEVLKGHAEDWLVGFVASVGAVFPEAVLELADQWKQFAAPGDAQDECASELRETIAATLSGPGPAEDIVAASIEQQSAYRNELRHLPGYMTPSEPVPPRPEEETGR